MRTRTSFALLRFALVCLRGQEKCHVKLKMLILTSKLLKEPSNRAIDVFPSFKCLRLLIGKLERKINSNRFISRLMDQKLITVNPLLSPPSQISPPPLSNKPPLFRGGKLISPPSLLSPPPPPPILILHKKKITVNVD